VLLLSVDGVESGEQNGSALPPATSEQPDIPPFPSSLQDGNVLVPSCPAIHLLSGHEILDPISQHTGVATDPFEDGWCCDLQAPAHLQMPGDIFQAGSPEEEVKSGAYGIRWQPLPKEAVIGNKCPFAALAPISLLRPG